MAGGRPWLWMVSFMWHTAGVECQDPYQTAVASGKRKVGAGRDVLVPTVKKAPRGSDTAWLAASRGHGSVRK